MKDFKLRAASRDECESMILTFHGKWHLPLVKGEISVVFRKKGPTWFSPTHLYAYMSKPVKGIVARMPVAKYEFVPIESALEVASRGKIGKEELRAYAADYVNLLLIGIGPVAPAKSLISFELLAREYDFWPSSTFMPLSKSGMDVLDRLGDFVVPKTGRTLR